MIETLFIQKSFVPLYLNIYQTIISYHNEYKYIIDERNKK